MDFHHDLFVCKIQWGIMVRILYNYRPPLSRSHHCHSLKPVACRKLEHWTNDIMALNRRSIVCATEWDSTKLSFGRQCCSSWCFVVVVVVVGLECGGATLT